MNTQPDHYAIVVGVDRYDRLPPLRTAVSDANAFARWLMSAQGGSIPSTNVRRFLAGDGRRPQGEAGEAARWAIDRALREWGLGGGARIGERLTFYFAGYSLHGSTGDTSILLPSWSPDEPNGSINLDAYQTYFREAGPFSEVIFILDTLRLPGVQTIPQRKEMEFPRVKRPGRAGDVAVFALEHHSKLHETRGLLTWAVLEALEGRASMPGARVTAASLGNYAVDRVAALATVPNPTPVSLTVFPSTEFDFGGAPGDKQNGTLVVELPHWTAQLYVYDHRFRRVTNLGPTEEAEDSGLVTTEVSLPPGIYQVEVHLEEQAESQFVLVHAGHTARISRDSWQVLAFESAAPLAGMGGNHATQMEKAEETSKKVTWPDAPGGDSRLFLFVRTESPRKNSAFDKGLKLLDASGRLITDFTEGIEKDKRGGWMAFNADLPAGYYVLRRGRRGVRVQMQPIYLCAGWETHVFLQARHNYPSMRTMALNMSPLGQGFRPDDAAAAAAEAVLSSLRHEPALVFTERLQLLLDAEQDNPWLSILASYALMRGGSKRDLNQLHTLLLYLQETIGDHPDVRALVLQPDEPAAEPFWNPPLLHVGLDRVHAHATRHTNTIPLDSLCDIVLDNHILTSHWTSWHMLDRKPVTAPGERSSQFKTARASRGTTESPVIAPSLANLEAPHLPVYQISAAAITGAEPPPVSPLPSDLVSSAALLQLVQRLSAPGDLPDRIQVDLGIDEAFLAEVAPEDISQASGVPLARVERGLARLQEKKEAVMAGEIGTPLSADERVVFDYALQRRANRVSASLTGSAARAPEEVEDWEKGPRHNAPRLTIEATASSLSTEADRVARHAHSSRAALDLARRLAAAADNLLRRADYMLVMDPNNRITHLNGALLVYLTPEVEGTDGSYPTAETIEEQRRQNRERWEAALQTLPDDAVTMSDPIWGAAGPTWRLKRTVVSDQNGQERARLYSFRRDDVPPMPPHVLPAVTALLPELTFNSSMFAYSGGQPADRYLQKLGNLVDELEQAIST